MKRIIAAERGFVVLIAVSLVAMIGMAALAIDLGMLRKAKAEAQRAADAAALAGASAFQQNKTQAQETADADHLARVVADTNYMNGVKIDSTSEVTVWVIPDSVKVRVRVRRAAVPTWFAQIFGINSLPVGAKAAAVASWEGSGTACVKPIAFPDLWDDSEDTNGNHIYDAGETWTWNPGLDTYHPANWDSDSDGQPNEGAGTGLGSDLRNQPPDPPLERDWGRLVVMRSSVSEGDPNQPCPGSLGSIQGNKCYVPGWWGLWGGNVPDMRDKILGCDTTVVDVGETVPTESGWKQTLNNSVETVFNRDPGAHWDDTAVDSTTGFSGSVVGSSYGNNWRASPRTWIIAMVAPGDMPPVPSDHDTKFNNFMMFFFDGCIDESGTGPVGMPCNTRTMMIGHFVGAAKGTATGPTTGTMIQILRLVE